jgi:futalosine hydrolase
VSTHAAPTLLLVPTALEMRELAALGGFDAGLALVEEVGFGPIAAAAHTAALLARLRPARVLLVGIAGSYDVDALAIGSAAQFTRVAIEGLETAGFAQAPGIGTSLPLEAEFPDVRARALVTVLSAARSTSEATERRERHTDAIAEDMEGYGVALACAMEHTPLAIVRGISNRAGDRDVNSWKIADALAAARRLAIELLGRRTWSSPR